MTYLDRRDRPATAAKTCQAYVDQWSSGCDPTTRMIRATALPVSIALAGHTNDRVCANVIPTSRIQQEPIVRGLPDVPGIGAAMRLTPTLGTHLRGLADELLVNDFPGATIRRDEREVLATAVSAANDCFFCMDSHSEHAVALLGDGAA